LNGVDRLRNDGRHVISADAQPEQLSRTASHSAVVARDVSRAAYVAAALVGLGGLFAGVTGPLLSNYVPILVRDALGDQRTAIGAVMAVDNVLLLLLVPWAGIASDRAVNRGKSRLPLVLLGYLLAAVGMAIFPASAALGIWGIVGAIVVLYSGLNIQRSPFQALMADIVPSRYRSLATASVMFQMCVGAIVFLMLGRALGMRPAFLVGGATVVAIGAVFAFGLREPRAAPASAVEATWGSLAAAGWSVARGDIAGLRAIFMASLLLQMVFQAFATWFALHGTERFGIEPADVAIGFIAWAIGGVIGALPAGLIGVRLGRRNTMMLGFALMAACFVVLDRVSGLSTAIPLLALASACWTLPQVNAYPLFIEPIAREKRGVLASLYLLAMALGGMIGDPLNGAVFDVLHGYRALFLLMAVYAALAAVAVYLVPRGAGEAGTGPDGRLVAEGAR
jgi:maltose/moltooligosaccharide transporter